MSTGTAGQDKARAIEGPWSTLKCTFDKAVATLTLDRPELNLMNVPMREELREFFERIRRDPEVRALVITGAGTAFSAGGDVNDFVDRSGEAMHSLMREVSHRWFKALWELPIPTVAAVNGVAAGGGINLALACDYVLASPEARFGQTFTKVGLMPDLGGLSILPRSIGLHRAKALCLSADLVDAEQAKDLGFVHAVVDSDKLLAEAVALARRLAAGPADAYAATKATLNKSFELSMEELLHIELYAQSYLFSTSDHEKLLKRFLSRSSRDERRQQ